jgi:hypothetical protein
MTCYSVFVRQSVEGRCISLLRSGNHRSIKRCSFLRQQPDVYALNAIDGLAAVVTYLHCGARRLHQYRSEIKALSFVSLLLVAVRFRSFSLASGYRPFESRCFFVYVLWYPLNSLVEAWFNMDNRLWIRAWLEGRRFARICNPVLFELDHVWSSHAKILLGCVHRRFVRCGKTDKPPTPQLSLSYCTCELSKWFTWFCNSYQLWVDWKTMHSLCGKVINCSKLDYFFPVCERELRNSVY